MKNIKDYNLEHLKNEIKELEGIDLVLSPTKLSELGINESMLSEDIKSIFESENYKMIFINSTYEIASDELNNQVGV